MKSIEQQKADLLDEVIRDIKIAHEVIGFKHDYIQQLIKCYECISETYIVSGDPFIHEIFDPRMCNIIIGCVRNKTGKQHTGYLKVSELPTFSEMLHRRGFGRKTKEWYVDTLKAYGLHDKLDQL